MAIIDNGVGSALALLDAMESLLIEAKADEGNRCKLRMPYFKPVIIEVGGDSPIRMTGFSRDLSVMGVGLLHDIELPPGEVILTFNVAGEGDIRLLTNIHWCKSVGQGWYISGGEFRGVMAKSFQYVDPGAASPSGGHCQ